MRRDLVGILFVAFLIVGAVTCLILLLAGAYLPLLAVFGAWAALSVLFVAFAALSSDAGGRRWGSIAVLAVMVVGVVWLMKRMFGGVRVNKGRASDLFVPRIDADRARDLFVPRNRDVTNFDVPAARGGGGKGDAATGANTRTYS